MIRHFLQLMESQEGQGLTEYALILTLIAVVAILALIFLGGSLSDELSMIGKSIADNT